MKSHWSKKLETLNACPEAVEFAREHESLAAAWKACERPDWMLWLIGESLSDDPKAANRRKFAGLTAAIARQSLKYAGKYRKQIEPTIRTVKRWARRNPAITLELLSAAEIAAESAARSFESVAWRAKSAAWSAKSAAWSAESAARSAARSAAENAAWSAARSFESVAWSAESAAWRAKSAAKSAESAARSARSAARSAAWSAARSAAWSAESVAWSAQCRLIRKHYPTVRIPREKGTDR